MRDLKIGIFLALTVFSINFVVAQERILENADFDQIIQNLLPQQEYDVNYSDLYDRLFTLYASPINLNRASRSELQSLYILDEQQIEDILTYRERFGEFRTFYELLTIESFDRQKIMLLQNFVTIEQDQHISFARALKDPSVNEMFLRYQQILEKKRGYMPSTDSTASRYLGGPARLYGRYLFAKPGRYSFGITTEKDAGEKFCWSPATNRSGMDYYALHAMVENLWVFDRILLGDFSVGFGQGLVFGSGIRIGKGAEPVTTIRRNNMGLRPYRSVYENQDYRGAAISTSIKDLSISLFASSVGRDARIRGEEEVSENDFSDPFVSYINSVGYHRTPNELASKHSMREMAVGGNVNLNVLRKKLEVGLNGLLSNYDLKLIPDNKIYQLFTFAGKDNHLGSLYFNYYFKNGHLFGEYAASESGGRALSSGLIMSLSSHVQTSVHLRHYDKDFHSFHGNAFGENSEISNEDGIFWGIRIKPLPQLLITGYFDYFSFPWLKYRVDAPSSGRDYMVSTEYGQYTKTRLRLRYRNKSKPENVKIENNPVHIIAERSISRIMLDVAHELSNSFSMHSWIQQSFTKRGNESFNGFLISQDIEYKTSRFMLTGRFAIFDADDFSSSLYLYERDLLYVYNVTAYYNKGYRYYLLGRADLTRHLSVWIRLSRTEYFYSDVIGNGLERIDGNRKTNLGIQMRYRF